MPRTYELAFIIDPRVSDEDATNLVEEYKEMLTSGGAEITKEESWGKRKLAYPIEKLNDGRYYFLYLDVDGKTPIPEVEMRMNQNEKVLRYLTVRTDLDLKRQESKGKNRAAQAEAEAQG